MIKFKEDICNAIDVMNNGGVILYPTDTVWGIGCDATREDAVQQVYHLKQRSESKSLIVLVSSLEMLSHHVSCNQKHIDNLAHKPNKPTTYIYPKAKNLANNVIASDGSIAIRIIRYGFSFALIENFGKPIVSTSANISTNPTPQNFQEISDEIINMVDYVVKYQQDVETLAAPSSIIKLMEDGNTRVIRD